MMLFAYRAGSASQFFEGLSEGEPAAWIILGFVLLLSGFSAWRKYNSFSS